jgi:hypothetical protein
VTSTDGSFARVDVSSWPVIATETVGVDARVWLRDDFGATWLYKPVTITQDGHRQGEDWAEKAASHLAELIEVPCAQIELARRGSEEGTVALNLRPDAWEMQSGAQLLRARRSPRFIPASELREQALADGDKSQLRQRPGHSLANIRAALAGMQPPPGHSLPGSFTAYDAFVGYLVLDAWIGNRDRHDENWAVLRPLIGEGPDCLCGSYDQAGCLGYNLRDGERLRRLAGGTRRDVAHFAARGDAWRFENSGPPIRSLVAHAVDGVTSASQEAAAYWGETIDRLARLDVAPIFDRLDSMSVAARTFACRLLEINGKRLRDEYHGRG